MAEKDIQVEVGDVIMVRGTSFRIVSLTLSVNESPYLEVRSLIEELGEEKKA